jgi:protein gp37
MAKTKIQLADKVWNPVTGCTKVSVGCENCYAERMAKRFPHALYTEVNTNATTPVPFNRVILHRERLNQPYSWKKPCRIFVNSMGDLFNDEVMDSFIVDVFATMAGARRHTFMILTKRPQTKESLYF